MNRFTNKTVLITGGSSGMGFAAAWRLLDEGAYVVITGRDQGRLDSAVARLNAAERALAVRADVSSLADLDHLMRRVETWRGGLDAVFANAGVGIFKPAAEITEADFVHTVDVNVKLNYLQPADALAAFTRGKVDAWAVWDPYTS
ncbi:SDR family NAD(P)-dependent oxidoreductase, partial [Streptomyces sp. NPDC050636]|uniref:SDR family NAD(P)-dependent oxidoreductase n=1 Tax=Streptomyces sp. NPDC050636 TaxID=3154510 RepID=UPI0034347CA1